ncbi:hypothetical protein F6V30_16355 [Oryzomonas sagensis]|uniref:DNA topoisomerase type IA zn finger domain-containing protein n=1 Tax=Oryzomonas sagensis TaxID=2603857 RepID=A0ABQ6TK35_9BACT|nr:hypothetical protein F6V30_16355 [Oryzomonas sagensis]
MLPPQSKNNKKCPNCGNEMKVREKKSGEEAGKKFLVCIKYPECWTIEPYVEPKWF